MQITKAGLISIEESEGWSSGPYWDSIGKVWTAYFGETKNIGPRSPRLTRAQGEQKLIQRFNADYAWALKPFLEIKDFTQNMYDALASFIWNCGTGAVGPNTTVGNLLRQGKWANAASALLAWCKAGGKTIPGLLARRQREAKLFFKHADFTVSRYMLTAWERSTVEKLEAERRIKQRQGGWDMVDSSHLKNAAIAKEELRQRVKLLEKADDKAKAHRRERIILLKSVIAGGV